MASTLKNDKLLKRYTRHIMLDDVGIKGQEKLMNSTVLIVGAGGLGSSAAMYLAASGVGCILIADADLVDDSNLQRQLLHDDASVGKLKVESAKSTLLRINPHIHVESIPYRLDAVALNEKLPTVDLALDCSDNFATRQAINFACVKQAKPLVLGAALGVDAQIFVYQPSAHSACYACLFPPDQRTAEQNCATYGILSPLVGVIGSSQALISLKLLLGWQVNEAGMLQTYSAKDGVWLTIRADPNLDCGVCAEHVIDATKNISC